MSEWKESTRTKKFDKMELEKSFQEACQDKDFERFKKELGGEDAILMRYTSQLEDALEEKKHCENCQSLSACKNKVWGYRLTPQVQENQVEFSYDACPYERARAKETAYQNYLYLFEMPEEIKKASLKEVYLDDKKRIPIMTFFKDFLKNYEKGSSQKGLYLYGSFGSGKTYLIAALFNELAKKKIESAIVYFPELLRKLKTSFLDSNELFERVKKAPLLLLDDIGAENMTPWARDEILGSILQYRMQSHLPTFFTSNFDLEQLEKHLSLTTSGVDQVKARRIIERMKQLSIEQDLISTNRRN